MPDLADQLQVLVDKDAIRDLMYRYTYYIDTNRKDDFLTLFTEDCVFDPGPGSGGPVVGRECVRAVRARTSIAVSSHHNANVLITFDGPARASVRTTFHAWHRLKNDTLAQTWGYYDDVVVRTDAGWRFAQRRIHVYGDEGFNGSWNRGERLEDSAADQPVRS